MGKKDVIGSWYNSGYHGHFRSKPRLDFINEYRNTAKPIPPKIFSKRVEEGGTKHPFSHHDNKHSFQNDALYFEQGLGRRRFRNKQTKWDSTLLSWMPSKKEWQPGTPMNSLYKVTYRGVPQQQIKQKLIQRPQTSYDIDPHTTTYRYGHGRDNPHKLTAVSNNTINVDCNGGIVSYQTISTNRKKRSTLEGGRDSVASCMTWHSPRPPVNKTNSNNGGRRPLIPAATQMELSNCDGSHPTVHFDTRSDGHMCDIVSENSCKPRVGSPISIATAPAELCQ